MRTSNGTPEARRFGPVTPRAIASSPLRTPIPRVLAVKISFWVIIRSFISMFSSTWLRQVPRRLRNSSLTSQFTPPTRKKLKSIRCPLMADSISTISSRLMKLYRIGVRPPMSRARNPVIRLWLKIRFSSTTSARMYSARFGALIP